MSKIQFQEQTLSLPDDYEGKVVATLISAMCEMPSAKAILYVHGYVDYFFQTHMAERFVREGWNFYALDLRKYGRSLLPINMPITAEICGNISRRLIWQ